VKRRERWWMEEKREEGGERESLSFDGGERAPHFFVVCVSVNKKTCCARALNKAVLLAPK